MLTYNACEALTGVILCTMVIFGPWAFGTTEPWAIWTMNGLGYALGALCGIMSILRTRTGYRPLAWSSFESSTQVKEASEFRPAKRAIPPGRPLTSQTCRRGFNLPEGYVTTALGCILIAILIYCLVSALNARATYLPGASRSEYHNCILWLPHSFDSRSTWLTFWTLLSLACSFWAVRAWILGTSLREQVLGPAPVTVPDRLRTLLWVMSINGALLALEGLIQRLLRSPKLLFLIKPQIHQTAIEQFGPFAYRANAAEYFNLLWPVCLGFWWTNSRAPKRKSGSDWLLVCVGLMAICPTVSTSRGGALVSIGLLIAAALAFLSAYLLNLPARATFPAGKLCLFFVGVPVLAVALGWSTLRPRLATLEKGFKGRERIYQAAQRMADDFPVFGTGPGTYASVSELYRPDSPDFWPAQVHDDWLETQITFGWVGSALIVVALALIVTCGFITHRLYVGRMLPVMTGLALAACVAHARFDFPFQIHSILFLFVCLCALTSVISWTAGARLRIKPAAMTDAHGAYALRSTSAKW